MQEYQIQFALNLLAYCVQRNLSPRQICDMAHVDFNAIKKGSLKELNPKQFENLWNAAIRLSNDTSFGLHFGESLQLSALGAVGQIIQASETVGEALTIAAKSVQLITDAIDIQVSKTRKAIVMRFSDYPGSKIGIHTLRHMREFFMVFAIHEMDGLILDKIIPRKILLKIDPTVDVSEYERVLRCRPEHKSGECLIEFDLDFWDEHIITANYDLQKHLIEAISKKNKYAELSLRERTEKYLRSNAYRGISSLEDIASKF